MPQQKWPADKIERRKLSALKPYPQNARTHSDEQVAQIAASMQEWGWTNPILVDESDGVIAGHGRILAAQSLGITDGPVMVARGWTEDQKRAYVIADNKLALNAGWDDAILSAEFAKLSDADFDLTLTGFGEVELAGFLNSGEGLTDPDDTPEVQETAVTVTGDTWRLGKHRLRCGDSTSADDVAALLAGVEPHLMVTDPPYGVEYDANWRNEADRSNGKPYGARAVGKVPNDDAADWTDVWALAPCEVAYVWHAGRHASEVQASLEAATFEIRSQIIWAKTRLIISRGDYHWQHEPCWYAVKKSCKGHWAGDRSQTTLWTIDHVKSETGHSTQKPVECMRRPIVNNSSPGQAVYDPFLGSGTTLIAAEMEGRHCYGMEIAPHYCDVIIRRWQDFTGQAATLEATGETFEEVENGPSRAAA